MKSKHYDLTDKNTNCFKYRNDIRYNSFVSVIKAISFVKTLVMVGSTSVLVVSTSISVVSTLILVVSTTVTLRHVLRVIGSIGRWRVVRVSAVGFVIPIVSRLVPIVPFVSVFRLVSITPIVAVFRLIFVIAIVAVIGFVLVVHLVSILRFVPLVASSTPHGYLLFVPAAPV